MSDDFSSDINTTGTIAPGGSATGVLETAYDRDWFKVSLVAGETYQFALSAANGSWGGTGSPNLAVYSGSGSTSGFSLTQVATGPAPAIWVRADTTGVYYLSVQNYYATGAYTVKASAIAADDYADNAVTTATLAVGGTVKGQLEVAGDRDAFQISLEAGKTYTLTATGGSGISSLALVGFYQGNSYSNTLYLPNSLSPDSSTVSFTPTTSGTFYAVASALDPLHGMGAYQLNLSLAKDDYAANSAGAATLKMGMTVQGRIDVAQDIDWMKVSLQANQSYSFLLSDPSSHTTISIVSEQGQLLSSDTTTLSGTGQVLTWTPPREGDYYVQIQTNANYNNASWTGPYSVSAALTQADDYSANSNTSGLLSINQTIQGHIEAPTDVDWIKVKLTAGNTYVYDLSAAVFPDGTTHQINSFYLVDPTGKQVAYADTGGNKDMLLTYTAANSADYFLVVNGSYFPLSSYSVTSYGPVADGIAGDASTVASLSEGSVVRSVIDAPLDRDWYKVELSANRNYSFAVDTFISREGTLGSTGGYANMKLIDSTGHVVASNAGYYGTDPVIYDYGSFAAGTYYIEVSASGLTTGTYTVKESLSGSLPDTTPPAVVGIISGPTTPGALNADIVVNFTENVQVGSGTIKLTTAAGALVESFDAATSSHLSGGAYKMMIDPSADLLPGTDYVVEFGIGSVMDSAGNSNTTVLQQAFHTPDAVQHLLGGAGNDIFQAGSAGGTYDGGAGIDTLIVHGTYNEYSVTQTPFAVVLANASGTGETETLTSVERVQFSNSSTLAFDIGGSAGEVYRLYQAAFGRTPDVTGLGYWITQADKGLSQHDIANSFVTSAEFIKLYGAAASDGAFLTALYQNVLHRAPDQGGQDYWLGQMQHGMAHADVLMAFSESPENQIATFLAIHNGISYTPY